MERGAGAWTLVVGLLLGCGSDKPAARPDDSCVVTGGECFCGTVPGSRGVNSCTGEPVGHLCSCTGVECVTEAGCAGTHYCSAYPLDCLPCVCGARAVAGAGQPRRLRLGGDGNAYIQLMDASDGTPAPIRVAPDGTSSTVTLPAEVGYYEDFLVAADGGLTLFGTSSSDPSAVQISRTSSSGELVGSTQWQVTAAGSPVATRFAGAGVRSDGGIVVAAVAYDTVAIGELSPDTRVVLGNSVKMSQLGSSPLAGGRVPTDFTLLVNDSVILGGYLQTNRTEGAWYAAFGAADQLIAERVDTDFDLFNPGTRLGRGPGGEVYSTLTWHYTDREPWQVFLRKMTESLVDAWETTLSSDATNWAAKKVVGLRDSVLVLTSGSMARFDQAGGTPTMASLASETVDAVLRGDWELLVLGRVDEGYSLSTIQLLPLGTFTATGP
jgi:hypothetical protein